MKVGRSMFMKYNEDIYKEIEKTDFVRLYNQTKEVCDLFSGLYGLVMYDPELKDEFADFLDSQNGLYEYVVTAGKIQKYTEDILYYDED